MKETRVCAALLALLLAIAALCYAPGAASELSELLPVETLVVDRTAGALTVSSGALSGSGADWRSAMEALRACAPGKVFLETADRVILTERAADALPELCADPSLRPAVQLFLLRGEPGEGLEEFAAARTSGATPEDPRELPVILKENGRYRLA